MITRFVFGPGECEREIEDRIALASSRSFLDSFGVPGCKRRNDAHCVCIRLWRTSMETSWCQDSEQVVLIHSFIGLCLPMFSWDILALGPVTCLRHVSPK